MELQLSKNLKSLRKESGKTQDELAAFLGISSQAVSKWERNEGFPDITLLPKIAAYFHTSIDDLLGVNEIAKQNRIEAITREYNRIRHHVPHDPNYRIDEGITLIRNALSELPGVFFFEQLLAADLSWKGRSVNDSKEKLQLLGEAISLCEDILERSNEDRWRDSAKQILLATYSELGMTEQSLHIAYQLPGPKCTREYMLTYILRDEELQIQLKENIVIFYKLFKESVQSLLIQNPSIDRMINERELAFAGIKREEILSAIKNALG